MSDHNKQLLILEDLGISKNTVQDLVHSRDLPYEVVWNESRADTQAVEILVNVKKTVDRGLLRRYPHLKAVAVAFTGYDSVDLTYCREHGVAVYNVPGYATASVTELVIGLTLGLYRQIPEALQKMKNGEWIMAPGFELAGKTVGIVGTGEIGLNTARVFKALQCKILGWSRTEKKDFKNIDGRYVSDKQTLFEQADIVSVHLPHNHSTTGIIGKKELSAMSKTSFLINTARGAIIDQKALIDVLENRQIAGAGLDVFSQEPLPKDHPLRRLDNVILTPHIAFKTEEALYRRAKITVENIMNYNRGDSQNRVD